MVSLSWETMTVAGSPVRLLALATCLPVGWSSLHLWEYCMWLQPSLSPQSADVTKLQLFLDTWTYGK